MAGSNGIKSRRLAILIDGDNAQAPLIDEMLAEAGKYGTVTIRRAYGDWTQPEMGGWKATLQTHAIQPMQQFRYTIGKNATDSALIIDAMDILHADLVQGFCLVSSDSDYTRLAMRMREGGFFVMGIGRQQTPRALVSACEVFVYTENLVDGSELAAKPETRPDRASAGSGASGAVKPVADSVPLLRKAFELAMQEDGWALLSTVGAQLRQLDPGFDSRTYGCKQLSALIRALPKAFEVRERPNTEGAATLLIRAKG